MVSGNNVGENLASAGRLIYQAAAAGAELVVLPETFSLFSAAQQSALAAQEAGDRAVVRPFLKQQAKEHGLWIVGGTLPMPVPHSEKVYASSFVVNPEGTEVARYDKLHLFDVDVGDSHGSYRESDTIAPGDGVVVVDTPLGILGIAVCYDIRFPELFRVMLQQSVDVVAIPAAFTLMTGEAHWLTLLKARAIETQCFIIGANQGGIHSSSRSTSGGSVIIDAWGRVLAEAGRGEACLVAEIDRSELDKIRADMPIRQHLRFDVVQNAAQKNPHRS